MKVRTQILNQWNTTKLQAKARVQDTRLRDLLVQSGLNIRPDMYYIFRVSLSVLVLIFAALNIARGSTPLEFIFPVLVWFAFDYRSPWPMSYVFEALKKQHAAQLNKHLFLLCALVKQELEFYHAHGHDNISLREILVRIAPHVPRLQSILVRVISYWTEDPKNALKRISDEINTEQARNFVSSLSLIESSNIAAALDIVKQQHNSFRSDRTTSFRSNRRVSDLVVHSIVWLGVGVVAWDLIKILQLYSDSLLNFSLNL